jgi:DNA-binding beta-propeller fold protein YncE
VLVKVTRNLLLLLAVLFCATCFSTAQQAMNQAAHAEDVYLRLVQTIPLQGVEGRIDHLSADLSGGRLFIAALGNNSVEVVNLRSGETLKSIKNLQEPQGVLYLPELKKLFVADGGDGAVNIYDGESLELRHTLRLLGGDADNVRYEPEAKKVYVGYGEGGLAVIDPDAEKIEGDIKLDTHPESFQLEKSGPMAYVNLPNRGQVATVDRKKAAIASRWKVEGAGANFPMALDEANHRLFVGCRKPARLLVYDTATGKQITSVPVAGDTDDVFYDSGKKRIYVSGGEGSITVIEQRNPDQYETVGKVATAPGARTSFFIPELHRLYLAVPHRGGQKAALFVYEVR